MTNNNFSKRGDCVILGYRRDSGKIRLVKCKRAFLNTPGECIAWNLHEEKKGFSLSIKREQEVD